MKILWTAFAERVVAGAQARGLGTGPIVDLKEYALEPINGAVVRMAALFVCFRILPSLAWRGDVKWKEVGSWAVAAGSSVGSARGACSKTAFVFLAIAPAQPFSATA